MSDKPAIDPQTVAARIGTMYPKPHDAPCAAREKRALGDAFGLSQFGVNMVTLAPGVWSSQRHWHANEDEFIYIVSGRPTLVTDEGEMPLEPGMVAGFPAGTPNGHHLVNGTAEPVVYIEVGTRRADEDGDYPDIDMTVEKRDGVLRFLHRDGTPYETKY